MSRDFLADAERLAPAPDDRDATREVWARHFAATALAAHAEFRHAIRHLGSHVEPGSRPDLGHLMGIATSATAAVIALLEPDNAPARIWRLTPELGDLNGDCVDALAGYLDKLGINPADLYPWYEASDFASAARINPDPNHEPDATCPCQFCVWVADGLGLDTPNLRPVGSEG